MKKVEPKKRAPEPKKPEAPAMPAGLVAPLGEEIDGGDVDEVIKLDENEAIEVVYRGYKAIRGKKEGDTNRLHKMTMADGVDRGMYGTMKLDSMLERCKNGDSLWIAYLGKRDIPGNKTMHEWKVIRTGHSRGTI